MRNDYDPRMGQFWKHGLCPVTGLKSLKSYTKVSGSGSVRSLKLPTFNTNRFRNHKV